MTTKEFEEFLVSVDGLISGYNGNKICFNICECGDGWLEMIKDLINELIAAGWDKEICQIKEKFGGLRFYINGASEEVHNIIHKYEKLSYTICENCGSKEAKLEQDKYWWSTRCIKCKG